MPVPAAAAAAVELADEADQIRQQLLDAAAVVFAERGYDGTRIQEVVRRAGLSTGAVYGRFASKDELLREAIISRSIPHALRLPDGATRVADLVERLATRTSPELEEQEALLLEAYVSARRHPEIAAAINEASVRWRTAVGPLVEAARRDGSLSEAVDDQSVLFLMRILRLGLLLHRTSGLPEPDAEHWSRLVSRVVSSLGSSPRSEGDLP